MNCILRTLDIPVHKVNSCFVISNIIRIYHCCFLRYVLVFKIFSTINLDIFRFFPQIFRALLRILVRIRKAPGIRRGLCGCIVNAVKGCGYRCGQGLYGLGKLFNSRLQFLYALLRTFFINLCVNNDTAVCHTISLQPFFHVSNSFFFFLAHLVFQLDKRAVFPFKLPLPFL